MEEARKDKPSVYQRLKLYVDMNRSFVEDKFQDMFRVQLLEDDPLLNSANINKIEKLINEILNFDHSADLKDLFDSLPRHVNAFCADKKVELSIDSVMHLIFYCLQKAFPEEARHYNNTQQQLVDDPHALVQLDAQHNSMDKSQVKINSHSPDNQQLSKQATPNLAASQKTPETPKKDILQLLHANINQYQELLKQQNLSKQEKFLIESALTNLKLQEYTARADNERQRSTIRRLSLPIEGLMSPCSPSPRLSPEQEKETVEKKLSRIFYFYCEQQQNVGAHTTFDRIKAERESMTLGKFLIFCNLFGVTSERLNKQLLIQKFKRIAEGFQQIYFDKFYKLYQLLESIDPEMPQRIKLDDVKAMRAKLKTVKSPFCINDKQYFRQIKRTLPPFNNELTSHSGQCSYSLREELQSRKMLKSRNKDIEQPHSILSRSGLFSLQQNNQISNQVASTLANQSHMLLQSSHSNSGVNTAQNKNQLNNSSFISNSSSRDYPPSSSPVPQVFSQAAEAQQQTQMNTFTLKRLQAESEVDQQAQMLKRLIIRDEQEDGEWLRDFKIEKHLLGERDDKNFDGNLGRNRVEGRRNRYQGNGSDRQIMSGVIINSRR